jgi:prepilin-type N-terminal cleavage/methylation domain-containing protein
MKYLARGFTLLEVVVYVALFSILIGGAMLSVFEMISSSGHSKAKITLEEEGSFLLSKIEWELSGAQEIRSPLISATSSTLSLLIGDTDSVSVTNAHGAMLLQKAEGVPIKISSDDVVVDRLLFHHNASSSTALESIEFSFSLEIMDQGGHRIGEDFSAEYYAR